MSKELFLDKGKACFFLINIICREIEEFGEDKNFDKNKIASIILNYHAVLLVFVGIINSKGATDTPENMPTIHKHISAISKVMCKLFDKKSVVQIQEIVRTLKLKTLEENEWYLNDIIAKLNK